VKPGCLPWWYTARKGRRKETKETSKQERKQRRNEEKRRKYRMGEMAKRDCGRRKERRIKGGMQLILEKLKNRKE
jgi:hypothetical protein